MRSVTTTLRDHLHQSTTGRVVDLVTLTLSGGSIFRWAGHHQDVTTGGYTWTAGGTGTAPLVGRGKIRDTLGLDPSELEVRFSCGSTAELGAGVKLTWAAAQGVLDAARVKLERAYLDAAGAVIGTLVRFEGDVSEVQITGTLVTVKCVSDAALLNLELPRHFYKQQCSHALFDAGCGVSRAAYVQSGPIDTWRTPTASFFTIAMAGTVPMAQYAGGSLKLTSGALTGVVRTIGGMAQHPTLGYWIFYVDFPLPLAPAIGDMVEVTPGCDKSIATCRDVFLNLPRRRGFDFIPAPEVVGS